MECLSAPFSNIQMDVSVLLKLDYSDETGRTYESCTHLELFNAFSTPDGLVVFIIMINVYRGLVLACQIVKM